MSLQAKVRCLMLVSSVTAALLVSCTGKVRYPDYYKLAVAPTKQPPVTTVPSNVTVAVRRFETPGYVRQGRIVYRETPERVGFYEYHRWASDPGVAVTTAVIDSLRASGRFSSVTPYDGQEHSDYVLDGRIEKLEEVDYKSTVSVEVELSASLVNARTGAAIWSGSVAKTADVGSRDMNSVVSAMTEAADDGIEQLVTNMQSSLLRTASLPENTLSAGAGVQ